MKKYKIRLNLDGEIRQSYIELRQSYIELENDLTEDEIKEAIKDYIDELFDYRYEEVIDEGY